MNNFIFKNTSLERGIVALIKKKQKNNKDFCIKDKTHFANFILSEIALDKHFNPW